MLDFFYSDFAIWIARAIIVVVGIIVIGFLFALREFKSGCSGIIVALFIWWLAFKFGGPIVLTIIYVLLFILLFFIVRHFLKVFISETHKEIVASGERRSFNKMAKKANNPKKNKKMTSKEYHDLAEKYEKGIGVEISLRKALEYYRKAAECGDAKEKRAFGKRYEEGDFLVRKADMTEAQKWYDAADEWEKENNKKE